jgi:quercetin dioxygenase-like cupin family protein
MVPEAPLEDSGAGLVPAGEGWFVLNVRDARWIRRPGGRGHNVPLTGWTEHEAETYFPMLGMAVIVLEPGESVGMYHQENDAEAFLVLSGEGLLLVEGQERPLRQWDFFHCPPGTDHIILGAGDRPCVVVATSSRQHQAGDWGAYTVDELAQKYGFGVEEETSDSDAAYSRFPPSEPVRYDGWLPS